MKVRSSYWEWEDGPPEEIEDLSEEQQLAEDNPGFEFYCYDCNAPFNDIQENGTCPCGSDNWIEFLDYKYL